MNRIRAGQYAISLFLSAATVIYLVAALSIGGTGAGEQGTVGAATLPVVASIVLLALLLAYAIQTFLGKNDILEGEWSGGDAAQDRMQQATEYGWRERWLRSPLFIMGATILYILLVSSLGFIVPTAAFMLAGFALLGMLSWVTRILITGGFLLFTYLLFVEVLLVSLPEGPWGF